MITIKTMSILGLEVNLVEVQTVITGGLPNFEIVGLPDTSIREAKERIRAAIFNSGMEYPSRRITMNLAPANTRKEGTSYDLPMAIGILSNLGEIPNENLEKTIFLGELGLDGIVNPINGVLPMCIEAAKLGMQKVILPKANEKEGAIVPNLEIIGVESLHETVEYIQKIRKIPITRINVEKMLENTKNIGLDMAEVKGQEDVKRALEISAAGGHNCILIGSFGSREDNVSTKNSNNITRPKHRRSTRNYKNSQYSRQSGGRNRINNQKTF